MNPTPDATPGDELPPELEERVFQIQFGLGAEERGAAFESLIASTPAHEAGLRRAMRRLAEADAAVGGLQRAVRKTPLEPEPTEVGPYAIVRLLGEGGMGRVYLAEQSAPVRRQVALKVIKRGMDGRRVLSRFEIERQSLAMMRHDHIAKIFNAGATDSGQPYFVMEYVDGVPLDEYCDERRLDVHARLELFVKVCAGVQHAHQKGVVHRDLKPSNILVADQDGRPVPKIIDFGLAYATDRDALRVTLFTEAGETIGTPEYMSPEQAGGGEVDTRTDIYSLGVVLYELLVGELPIVTHGGRRADLREVHRLLAEVDPPPPSRRLAAMPEAATHAARRSASVESLQRALRGDLDWIVLQSMEKDPGRRYATANALLEDIGRHLAHEPVMAAAPSTIYRLRKFARRNRTLITAGAALLVALVAGTVGTTLGMIEARDAEHREKLARAEADRYLTRYDLLRNVVLLREAREAIPALYPEDPQHAGAMRRWIERQGRPLIDRLPALRAARAELQPGTDGGRDAAADRFLADALSRLITDIEAFGKPVVGELARVEDSLAWAEQVRSATLEAPSSAWEDALAAIAASDGVRASVLYRNLAITPQLGLVPLGPDPDTGLWEFAFPRSGRVPERGASGRLEFDGDCALVLVLVPGGEDLLGAQRDPQRPNFDALANPLEAPVRRVSLDPFFVSKYEMTQGQWMRLDAGHNPSRYSAGKTFQRVLGERGVVTAAHPVELVSWHECRVLLGRHGLDLPTSAQWEYACRAGRDTPWWTGVERDSLRGAVNIADRSAGPFAEQAAVADWPELDDGWPLHAPVHTLKPNPFGLHHVHGNVWEWCRDRHAPEPAPRDGDGERASDGSAERAHRGGGFMNAASAARCASYSNSEATGRWADLGLRPVRPLERPEARRER